jgi:PAS domain S-box-containing protein
MGADKFIRKPAEPVEFIQQIQAVLKNFTEGRLESVKAPEVEEKEILKLYDERLVKKLERKILQLEQANAERKQTEEALKKKTIDLGERMKELRCLYGISKLFNESGESVEESFKEAVHLIPPGWYYPEIACARITLKEREFATGNFRKTPWKLSAGIIISGVTVGSVEVYYLEERPTLDEGPFLKEERTLIDELARQLGSAFERKQAEAALKKLNEELELRVNERTSQLAESEEKYRVLVENASEAVIVLQDNRMRFFNRKTLEMSGYSSQEITAKTISEFVYPQDRQMVNDIYSKRLQGKDIQSSYEFRMLQKNGNTLWVNINSVLITWNGKPATLALVTDISERKK